MANEFNAANATKARPFIIASSFRSNGSPFDRLRARKKEPHPEPVEG
jgi:hypothetical protein